MWPASAIAGYPKGYAVRIGRALPAFVARTMRGTALTSNSIWAIAHITATAIAVLAAARIGHRVAAHPAAGIAYWVWQRAAQWSSILLVRAVSWTRSWFRSVPIAVAAFQT